MSALIEDFTAIVPLPRAVERGQRIRRVWAELTRAQAAGEAAPGMRQLARRCRLPSSSTAQTCVDVLVAMGVVVILAEDAELNTSLVSFRADKQLVNQLADTRRITVSQLMRQLLAEEALRRGIVVDPNPQGKRGRRVTPALWVVRPYGWECLL